MSGSEHSRATVPTGIGGFDQLAYGGLPALRSTLLEGTTGSGKTVFAIQFLAEGVRQHAEPGVFVTFEESPVDLRSNMTALGYKVAAMEEAGAWIFVDASPVTAGDVVVGDFDFGGLVARIQHAVDKIGAKRVVLDSIGALFSRFSDPGKVRFELFGMSAALKEMQVTSLFTMERSAHGSRSGFGVEEFVADNVVVLRNIPEEEKRRRTVEILKLRGAQHRTGEWLFAIVPGRGIMVVPSTFAALRDKASTARVSSGCPELDGMVGGGFYRDSVTVVSGPTGVGKTLMCAQFLAAGVDAGERCLLFSFEESREELLRNARTSGVDLNAMEDSGKLKMFCEYPEVASLEEHFVTTRTAIDEFQPRRLAIDNLSALERVATPRGLRDFILGMASFVKNEEICGLFTSATETLLGSASITEAHISTLADTIVMLRFVEIASEVRRAVAVLKARGSAHDRTIREFTIDEQGMHIGSPFHGVTGLLTGGAVAATTEKDGGRR
ncbi:circadian clock protein KaiC [soil metagenome]